VHRSFGDAAGRQFGITSLWCWADLEAACRPGWEPSTKFLWFSVHREDAYPIIMSALLPAGPARDFGAQAAPFVTVLNCRNPHVRSTHLIFEKSVIQIWTLRFTFCFHYIRGECGTRLDDVIVHVARFKASVHLDAIAQDTT
jgi:hypothetical protein